MSRTRLTTPIHGNSAEPRVSNRSGDAEWLATRRSSWAGGGGGVAQGGFAVPRVPACVSFFPAPTRLAAEATRSHPFWKCAWSQAQLMAWLTANLTTHFKHTAGVAPNHSPTPFLDAVDVILHEPRSRHPAPCLLPRLTSLILCLRCWGVSLPYHSRPPPRRPSPGGHQECAAGGAGAGARPQRGLQGGIGRKGV